MRGSNESERDFYRRLLKTRFSEMFRKSHQVDSVSVQRDLIVPPTSDAHGIKGSRFPWQDWLKVSVANHLRLENWPLGLDAPGPNFNVNSLGLEEMKQLVHEDENLDDDGDTPYISKWSKGKHHTHLVSTYISNIAVVFSGSISSP